MSNAHWGYWTELSDDTDYGRRGALLMPSKNLGDGGWCVQCLRKGFYSWIDLKCCPKCKGKFYTTKDKA